MTTTTIREKLMNYLQVADDKKLKAIYTMVEDEIDTAANDWNDDFIKELKHRSKTFIDGTARMYSWEETKDAARAKSSNR